MPSPQYAPSLDADNAKNENKPSDSQTQSQMVNGNGIRNNNEDSVIIKESADTKDLLEKCDAIAAKVNAFLGSDLDDSVLRGVQSQTRIALEVIEDALGRYSLDELSISYNGGKDCLVLLILLLAGLSNHHHRSSSPLKTPIPPKFPSVYIISPHPFAEVTQFVNTTSTEYHLSLSRYAMPMKEAFTKYLQDHKNVKAIMVGTRRTDPHGSELTHFDMTDGGWPRFMRIHPVIDWHYREIWGFIRHLQIPYCELYDQGYTSLGGTTDTHPNPVLVANENEKKDGKTFRPAYELVEDMEERLGRDR